MSKRPRRRRRKRTSRAAPRPPRDDRPESETASDSTPTCRGVVLSITSGACRVACDQRILRCVLPSRLARDQRALVAVGDQVEVERLRSGNHRVREVLPRDTVLSRPDPRNPRRQRVLAANVGVVVHVASVVRPPLRLALIDRYLIAIQDSGAKPVICVNKIDLLTDEIERCRELERLEPYRRLGVPVVACSAKTGEGLAELRRLLAGRTAVLVGHSGAGKSSLLNALAPGRPAATGRVSRGRGTGRHTTSRSHLYQLPGDTRIIDTPGIREFGLWKLTPAALHGYFPDFEPHATACRFADCSHTHEPGCAVRPAVDSGDISAARYAAYLRIRQSVEKRRA